MTGNDVLYCNADAEWEGIPPTCIGKRVAHLYFNDITPFLWWRQHYFSRKESKSVLI